MSPIPKSRSKTTETSISIIYALVDTNGTTIDDLAERLDLAPSTVHRHLVTLREHNFVTKRGDTYHIGLKFLTIGWYAKRQVTAFPMIKEKVEQLAEISGEKSQFIVEEEGERVYIYTMTGQRPVDTGAYIGKRGVLHTSAAGKAILASLSADRVDEIIEKRGLKRKTEHTIVDPKNLHQELKAIRERGYALNLQETTNGVNAVGAVVKNPSGDPVGALSISGPATRVTEQMLHEEYADEVLCAVNELELHIEHAI